MPDEEKGIEIAETPEVKEEAFDTEGLTDGEVELAREHGFIDKEEKAEDKVEIEDDKHEEQPKPKTEDSEEDKGEEKPKTFEDLESDEGKLKKFSPNEQALYWKWKSDKKKRQAAQKDYEELKAEHELSMVKHSAFGKKIEKIQQKLESGEDTTVEELKAIIGSTENSDNSVVTKADLEEREDKKEKEQKEKESAAREFKDRIETAENIGFTKYGKDEFNRISQLANEVKIGDKTNTYESILLGAFSDKDIDEDELVERVVTIARLHPDFGKKSETTEEKTKNETKADRAIKNSKKKVSSASIASSGGKRVVTHDDLTADDATKLTTKQWMELPDKVRERLLRES